MKKFVAGILLLSVFWLTGCEKKDPNAGKVIPAGQNYKMQVWTADEGESIDALTREFISATKASGLTINVVKFPSEEVLQKTLVEKMAEGQGPDVIFTTGEWVYNNSAKLTPLTQSEGFTADRFGATFVTAASQAMVKGGQIYGVPIAVDSLAVIYNEDYLISHLVDSNSPGDNWREFRENTEQLTKEDNSLERFSLSGAAMGRFDNLNYGYEILENIMLQMGTMFFTPDGTEAKFASSIGVSSFGKRQNFGEEAINFFVSFALPQYKNFSWNEMLADKNSINKDFDSFIKGKTAMVFGFSRDLFKIKNLINNWDNRNGKPISEKMIKVDFLPQFTDNGLNKNVVVAKVFGFAVPKTAPHPNLSWKFLKYLAKKEVANSFHATTKLPTARLDLILEQAGDPEIGFFVRQAKFAKNNFFPVDKVKFKLELSSLIQEIHNKKTTNVFPLLKVLENKFSADLKDKFNLEKVINRQQRKVPTSSK